MVMDCEICGQPIQGRPVKLRVAGAVVLSCKNCSDLGERVHERRQSSISTRKKQIHSRRESSSPPHHQTRKPPYHGAPRKNRTRKPSRFRLVENFDTIVREARGDMPQEDFAQSLNEKNSLIQKIETGKIRPTHQLARKIEKQYHVTLLEKVEEAEELDDLEWKSKKKDSFVPTLGDFIKKND
ncbi:TIGR00270 family protein [Candidatus Bathyarchaeota archaeon]|nr:TIGR00270 family protein [Candidatus Bathyarchaeota archaeon]